MKAKASFLDVFRGDQIEIDWEDEDNMIHTEKAKVVSVSQNEPERINGIPMAGFKQAKLEIENNEGLAEVYWIHMKREIEQDGDLKFGNYKQTDQDEIVDPTPEKQRLGKVRELEVIE